MTALKVLVACVSMAVLGIMVAVPYKLDERAGVACLAATVIAALGALSVRFRKAMDRARPAAERFWRRRYGPPIVILLLVSPVFLRDVLPELLMWVHAGVAWSLMTGWLCYKVVETLRGPPAEPEPRAT